MDATSVKLLVLADVVRRMSEGNQEADASTRLTLGETARQKALRDALCDEHMVPISRIARHVFGVPGMDVKFQLPKKLSDNDTILGAAHGMVAAAEPHAAVFVQQEGLPADFLEQFRKNGVAAVDVLDTIVKPRLAGQPELLAAWNSVKRPIEQGGGVGIVAVDPAYLHSVMNQAGTLYIGSTTGALRTPKQLPRAQTRAT